MGAIENLKTFMDVNAKGAVIAAQITALQDESKAALAAAVANLDRAKAYVWLRSNDKALLIHFANDVANVMEVEVLTEDVPESAPAENVVEFKPADLSQEAPAPEPVPLAVSEPNTAHVDPPTPA